MFASARTRGSSLIKYKATSIQRISPTKLNMCAGPAPFDWWGTRAVGATVARVSRNALRLERSQESACRSVRVYSRAMPTSRVRLGARARARGRGRGEATLTELVDGAYWGRAHAHRRVCSSQSKIVRHVGTPRLDLRTFSARTTRAAHTLWPERRRQFAPACGEPLAERIGAHATLPEARCSKLYAQMDPTLLFHSHYLSETLRFSGHHEFMTPLRVRTYE